MVFFCSIYKKMFSKNIMLWGYKIPYHMGKLWVNIVAEVGSAAPC